ncbi:MAG: hypothetical protein H8D47_00895 [Planctomycetes bacterium]|nr:hypothetical protein [Planctomycetota bacterium]MBL7106360.1 hypothetical protein [Phycisphaerae bacterium]
MTNVTENPLLLLTIAALAIVALWLLKVFAPEKHRPYYWAIPLAITLSALALDFFIKTDLEKINLTIKNIVKAGESENPDAIAALLSNDYNDSLHLRKNIIVSHCKQLLTPHLIDKAVLRIISIQTQPETAQAVFTVNIFFEQDSTAAQYKKFMFIKMKTNLKKNNSKNWLIKSFELVEINKQKTNWKKTIYNF